MGGCSLHPPMEVGVAGWGDLLCFGARWGLCWCPQTCASPRHEAPGTVWLLTPPCRVPSCSAWKLATRTETERLNHSVGPGGGKGWEWKEGGGKRLPAPHPALPEAPAHRGFSSSAGHRAGAEPPDPRAKLRAGGGSAGRGHPLHPALGQSCPVVTWEELALSPMGHSHPGRGVPARWGVAGGTSRG